MQYPQERKIENFYKNIRRKRKSCIFAPSFREEGTNHSINNLKEGSVLK